MQLSSDRSWRVSVGSAPALCFALYLRDCAGLGTIGSPAVSPVRPAVHCTSPEQTVHAVGGLTALRVEWEAWWYELAVGRLSSEQLPTAPDFPELGAMPALQRLTHAHYGAATAWVQDADVSWRRRTSNRVRGRTTMNFGSLVREREFELGRAARKFNLEVLELPLSEPRAWFVEPSRLLASEDLFDDEALFRSYVQPVVEILA